MKTTIDDFAGYSCANAAEVTVARLHPGLKKKPSEYNRQKMTYLQAFDHYWSIHPKVRVGKAKGVRTKRISTRFVEAIIAYWNSCERNERLRLTADVVHELMQNPTAFIDKVKKVYSEARAKSLLGVSRQTVNHYMKRALLSYIVVGNERRPLRTEVDAMVAYGESRPEANREVYIDYFVELRLISPNDKSWPKHVRKRATEPIEVTDTIAYKTLERRVERLSVQVAQLRADKKALAAQVKTYKSASKKKSKRVDVKETKQYRKLEARVQKLSSQVKELREDNKGLRSQAKAYEKASKKKSKAVDATQTEQYRLLETRVERLSVQVAQLRADKKALAAQVRTYERAGKKRKKTVPVTETKTYKALERRVERLSSQVAQLKQDKQKLADQVKTYKKADRDNKNASKEYRSKTEQKIKDLQERMQNFEGQIAELQEEKRNLEGRIAELQEETETKQEKATQASRDVIDSLQKERDEARRQLKASQEEYATLLAKIQVDGLPYDITKKYDEGDVIHHGTHGKGKVTEAQHQIMKVRLEDGTTKKIAHNMPKQ